MFHKPFAALALAATAVLAACTPPSDPNALPGTTQLSGAQAAGYFQQVCGANRNNYSGAVSTLGAGPYIYNGQDDRYYHQQVDLSFRVSNAAAGRTICEMGWRGTQGLNANRAAIRQVSRDATVRYDADVNVFFASSIDRI